MSAAPTVVATTPPAGATVLPLKSVMTATFSEAMSCGTINAETFSVSAGGAAIGGTIAYAGGTATFTPDDILTGGVTYTARLSVDIRDATGTPLASDYTWTFTPPFPQFAYVTNKTEDSVSVYWIDRTTGRLYHRNDVGLELGQAPHSPVSLSVGPSGAYAYVGNFDSNSVTTFSIDPDTGALTERETVSGVVHGPQSMVVESTGHFAYVANYNSNDVAMFSISQTGVLTPLLIGMGTATVPAGRQPSSLAIDPTGTYVYVANFATSNMTTFSIDGGGAQTPGALTTIGGAIGAGVSPRSVAVDPKGPFVYVADHNPNATGDVANAVTTVTMFRIKQSPDPNPGTLQLIGTVTVASASTGSAPESIVVDPSGRFVYVADSGVHAVIPYSIDQTTGALTAVLTGTGAGAAVGVGEQPIAVTVDPTGQFAYVIDALSNTMTTFSIDQSTGELTAVGLPVATGIAPSSMVIVDRHSS